MRLRALILLLLCIFASQSILAQLSTKHYIPPLTSSDGVGNQYIYISTPKNRDIPFSVTFVGQPASTTITGTVSNANPREILIGNNFTQLITPTFLVSSVVNNKGFIIDADDVIYVSIRTRSDNTFHAGALVSKGLTALGTQFRVGAFVRETQVINHLAFASVMATENNTTVTFSDLPATAVLLNYTGTFPFSVSLNEGESYIIAIQDSGAQNPNDLIGTLISSDKPIVVNSGSSTGSSGLGAGRDYGIDQIVDASKIGSEYIFVRGEGLPGTSDAWENVIIVAHQDATDIRINGTSLVATINAGQYYVIEGNLFNGSGNMYVNTSKPVFAYQSVGGTAGSEANQGMFFVPPLSCENRGDVNNIASINNIGNEIFNGGVTIVTNAGATVTVNGSPITSAPSIVSGNPNYVTYKINGLTGNVSVASTQELYCAYFNRNGFATSGSFYSGFPSPPEINFSNNVSVLGNCIPNLTIVSPNIALFDTVEWFFNDGSGFVTTGNTTNTITPTQAGRYKLVGTITCSGSTFDSQEIPVSLCPDDLDGDLIIDNVDVDFDNDGIANCDESRGNVNIDFTNINNPILNFMDSSTDATFITPTLNQTGVSTITGDATGNITTNVNPALNNELTYTLAFNEPANVEFLQNTAVTHTIVDGEVFTISIGPSTKNITLVDPDNILLIDTDFDDFFETGVNNFSASVIRFKLNPTPNGTTPFRFVASEVTQVSFRHYLGNLTQASSFAGNFKLTCFKRDSDGDNIPDALDADSDNDGIPDLVEASGMLVTLTGNDTNLDGLDDFFTSGTITPLDSDGDGVPNHLDLDSDNDGVYDLFESGHTQSDANLDGRIDNAAATVGANGLVNALETAPDNFILSYTVANPDADALLSFLDFDSDGDNCSDVIEAGYIDGDGDTIIGTSPVTVNAVGKVTGIPDGYTVPNSNYSTGAPIILNTPFVNVSLCENSTSTITIDSTADAFQWQQSTDGGTNWTTLANNASYSNVTTNTLQIANLSRGFNNYQYRVQLQRTGNSCGSTSNAITLTVEPVPVINTPINLRQCDDNNDGFSIFNLNEAAVNISANFANETFVFYPSVADAQAGTNAFTTAQSQAFTNRTVNTDVVGVRVISAFGCHSVGQVNLVVSPSATIVTSTFTPRTFTTCDDFAPDTNGVNNDRDGVSSFDFSQVGTDLLSLFNASVRPNLIVSYYRNLNDALSEINAITNPANYRNIGYPNSQQIFVRVDNRVNNDCVGVAPLINLVVDPVPTAGTVRNLELCDNLDDGDGFNGIVQTFNLSSQTATILGSQNPANYQVTYHVSPGDAASGANAITNTTAYENRTSPNRQTIYVRVTNTSNPTRCFTNHTSFDLIVHPLPVANPAGPVEVCDDDSDGSAQNGISQSIPIRARTEAAILGTQDPTQFSVSYHATRQNAINGVLPLNDVISNQALTNNIVYVRVFNSTTMCANGISQFDVIVHPQPALPISITNYEDCDNNSNGTFRDGIISGIDLDTKIPEILPGVDASQFRVSFHETAQGAINNDTSIPNSRLYQNTTPYRQTIYVRVETIATGCVNNNRLRFDIVINNPPVFELTTPRILCLGETLRLEPINEGPDNYDYEWFLPNGTSQLGRTLDIRAGGTYRLVGRASNGNLGANGQPCSFEQTVQVNESIIATITENDVTIVDDSNNNSITINPANLGIGNYEYALRNDDTGTTTNFQDSPVFQNLSGGIYTILVRDKNGCGTAQLQVSVLEFPKFFTPNGDGTNDTWAIKGANSTFYPTSSIRIFNRYGKVVAEINIDTPGWDGTYNGKTLPSDDYWFSIELVHRNTSRSPIRRKGNFSLLRRINP